MLLFLSAIALIIIGFSLYKTFISLPFMILGGFAAVMIGTATIGMQVNAPPARIAAAKEYETIMYQIDNEFYSNSNEVGKADIVRQIKEFNVKREKEIFYHNSLWLNWQTPVVYSAYPAIALPAYLAQGGGT